MSDIENGSEGTATPAERPGLLELWRQGRLGHWILRAISLILLLFALEYWARLTGVIGGDLRFDTMPPHWRVASAVLAVSLPIVSLGLWIGASWGLVLWLLAMIVEFVMYVALPSLFGRGLLHVAIHSLGALTFGAVWFVSRYWLTDGERRKASTD